MKSGRGTLAAATAVAAAIAAGCGGSDSSDDEAAVRQAVSDFYTALERKDGKRACAALTDPARNEVGAIDESGRPCEVALVDMFGGHPPPRILSIETDEREATVQLQNGEGGSASLVKQGDSWRLDAY